ncbi:GntR family transcriptional regulator [Actinoallomurus sp. CA-150999]|uniref:GntR family transcriptional regulator n=1 Tax=Actinoallomurus sp. CA-150999 TaxID=3239887 RepID=UPI003D8D72E1
MTTLPFRAGRGVPPLRDQVAGELRSRIADGRVAPGERLYEKAIADELGVSRLPVREAIRMLQSEGLVSVQPRRGVLVRRLNRQAVQDLFDVREALEVLAARLAAERADQAALRRLEELVEVGRRALDDGDDQAIAASNTAFHDSIYQLAGNALIPEVLDPLMGRLHWLFRQNVEPERVFLEHQELYRALAAHDPEQAADVALQHIRSSRRMVLEMLKD